MILDAQFSVDTELSGFNALFPNVTGFTLARLWHPFECGGMLSGAGQAGLHPPPGPAPAGGRVPAKGACFLVRSAGYVLVAQFKHRVSIHSSIA
jgi:hypothetical protein